MITFYHKIKKGSLVDKLVNLNAWQSICMPSYEPLEPNSMSYCASVCVAVVIENLTMTMSDGDIFQYRVIKPYGCNVQKCRLLPSKG